MIVSAASEWASAAATFAAVVVALYVAHREGRWRRADALRAAYDEASRVAVEADLTTPLGHFAVRNGSGRRIREVQVIGIFANDEAVQAPLIDSIEAGGLGRTRILVLDHQPDLPPVEREGGMKMKHNYTSFGLKFRDEERRVWSVGREVFLRRGLWRFGCWRRSDGVRRWLNPLKRETLFE